MSDADDETLRRRPPPPARRTDPSGMRALVVHEDDDAPPPRPRTNPHGVPAVRRSQRMLAVDPSDEEDDSGPHATPPADELGARIDMHLRRAFRGPRKLIATALIAALGSVGGLIVSALNSREEDGADKARLRYLERAVDRLTERVESLIYRSPGPWRRDEPDPMPRPATPALPRKEDP